MTIKLLQGDFEKNEAIAILTRLIDVKIKHHESSIALLANEEDVKSRENKIKNLQKSLFEMRQFIEQKNKVTFECDIIVN